MTLEIDERKTRILQAVVQGFILTGKPVGSRSIAESCRLGVSTATIRNELAALEKLGLLTQPHTSAGRVPTDIAYRYYVDMLMGHPTPSTRDVEAVERLFTARTREVEGIFREVSVLLSRLTHATALVFAPLAPTDALMHVDLVRISSTRVMVIAITSRGMVARRLISVDLPVTADTVDRVAVFVERSLAGKSLDEIDTYAEMEVSRFSAPGNGLVRAVTEEVKGFLGSLEERVFVGGTANILREIDTAGKEWVKVLLEAMERQYFILDLLKDLIRERQLTVRIGEENRPTELRRCAFVGTSYPVGEDLVGSLGVVGPTSIDYAHTIGMVEYMAENLGRTLLQQGD